MTINYQFVHLVEKMSNSDKDIRFMATNDMLTELQKDTFKLDDDNERKLVAAMLKILHDNSGEVQNLGVKCICRLIERCRETSAERIVDNLSQELVGESTEDRLRDISSLGLKAACQSLNPNSTVARRVATRLVNALAQQGHTVAVLLDVLDILSDLIAKQGHHLQSLHELSVAHILPYLKHDRQAVRKRAIQAIHKLSEAAATPLQNKLIESVIELITIKPPLTPELQKTALQALGSLVSSRCTGLVQPIVPKIYEFTTSEDTELREGAISAIDAILRRAPLAIHNLEELITILKDGLEHDPNYCGDLDDEDEEDDEDDDDEDDYSDDEDISWKVRRSAAKCIDGLISSSLCDAVILRNISAFILTRFREREESVLLEILGTFKNLVKKSQKEVDGSDVINKEQFTNQVARLLKSKKTKVSQGVLAILSQLVDALPTFLNSNLDKILPLLCRLMKDPSPSVRLDVLGFFSKLAKQVDDEVAVQSAKVILPSLDSAINDSFYKIVAEALRVVLVLIEKGADSYAPTCQAAVNKLSFTDIDQEVKDAAIMCTGVMLSKGALTFTSPESTLVLLIDRMSNEMTRLAAVKSLQIAMANEIVSSITPVMIVDHIATLASFLRKSQRVLRISTLNLLSTLIKNGLTDVNQILVELPSLVNEHDLHVAQLAMDLAVQAQQANISENQKITEKVLELVKSPLLQGQPLTSLLAYFRQLVKSTPQKYKSTARALTETTIYKGQAEHRNEIHNTARCLAELTHSWALVKGNVTEFIQPVIEQMLQDAQHSESEKVKQFSLLTLGEMGRRIPLGPTVIQQQISQFKTQSEDIKVSAAIGLGLTAAGNLIEILPILLNNLTPDDSQRNYLTLTSIRQATVECDIAQLQEIASDLFEQLQKFAGASEEGTRNVLSECLGRTIISDPSLCQRLQDQCGNSDIRVRQTQLATAKYVCHLKSLNIQPFLDLLNDESVVVRRGAIAFMNSVAHNNPETLRKQLSGPALNALYNETKIRPELIREVMMGPFKHKIDDGLEIRKAAFECLYSLLDTCQSQLDLNIFLDHIENGFRDDYDVKLLAFLILLRVIQQSPHTLATKMEKFIEHFKVVLNSRVKPDAVKQESERSEELKKSVIRVFSQIMNKMNEIELDSAGSRAFSDLLRLISQNPELNNYLEDVRRNSESSATLTGGQFNSNGDQMEWQ